MKDEDIVNYEFEDDDDDGEMHAALVLLAKKHAKNLGTTTTEELELEDDDDFDLWCTSEVYDYDIDNFADGADTLNYWYHRNTFNRSKINNLLQEAFNVDKKEVNYAS